MSGDATLTLLAGSGLHGTAHMAGTADERNRVMDMTEDSTRIGSFHDIPSKAR